MHQFKIFPKTNKPHHYLAFIFDTKKQMIDFQLEQAARYSFRKMRKFEAACAGWNYFQGEKYLIGHVYFYKGYLGAGVVAHEFGHATTFYFSHVTKKPHTLHTDEKYCTILGDMVKQFWNKYFRYCSRQMMHV